MTDLGNYQNDESSTKMHKLCMKIFARVAYQCKTFQVGSIGFGFTTDVLSLKGLQSLCAAVAHLENVAESYERLAWIFPGNEN